MPSIYFREVGEGWPLILLHGFCETGETWHRVADQLASDARVLTPDLPGFGRSLPPTGVFSIDDIADRIKEWIDRLRIQRPMVIGHSLGGYVTLALQERHPDLLRGLGLFNSTSLPDSAEKKESRIKVIDFVEKNGVGKYVDNFIPGLFHQKDNPHIRAAVELARKTPLCTFVGYTRAMMKRPSREHVIRNAQVPILLIAGEHDAGIPLQTIKAQAALNKRAALHVLPNTGHMGMFESEKASVGAISAFIKAES